MNDDEVTIIPVTSFIERVLGAKGFTGIVSFNLYNSCMTVVSVAMLRGQMRP